MKKRFLDLKHYPDTLPDFIKRRHGVPFPWLITAYGLTLLGLGMVTFMLAPQALPAILGTAAVLLAGFTAFAALYVHNTRDIIMATEFQNALFAGAMRANTEFCLIVKRDGTIMYSDINYNEKFSPFMKQGARGLDVLLSYEGLGRRDKDTLLKALVEGQASKVPFLYQKTETMALLVEPIDKDSLQDMELSVSPIGRPGGFMVIRAVKQGMETTVFRQFLETTNVPMFILRENGMLSYANKAFSTWLGYSAPLASLRFQDIVASPEALDYSVGYKGKLSLKTKNGETLEALAQVTPSASGGEYYGIFWQGNTAKPAISLADDGKAWELFIEHSPIAVAQLDEAGQVIKSNRAFRKITEREDSEDGWPMLDVIAHGREEVKQLMERVVNQPNGEERPVDIKILGQHGSTACLYVGRMENEEGTAGMLVHLIDTTEQKNLELRFAHSQKMQAVGQLAGGIAHDFNNLLTAMMGFCDLLLLRHPAGDPSFADIMQVKQNANRAANLVRQLLAFSRKQTLQPEILDITDVLAELSNLVRRLIGENIEFKINHGRDLGLVRVDQGQLEQVMINLAVNARDAMSNGGSLTIQTSNMRVDKKHPLPKDLVPAEDEVIEEGDYVLVEVIDTGHGIAKDVLRKIFEPFFSTKEVGSGTGLGLSTVYGIIKQTGGYVYVTSKLGKGTKFSIFLKSYKHNEVEKTVKKEEETASTPAFSKDLTGKETILLVEDEVPVRIFSAQALSNKGYTVLEAESGEAALKVVEEKGAEIDIIITDVIMPGMNGPTMVQEVMKTYPAIKVIFISGYAEDAFVKTYGTERKFNFLPKPFTLKQLAGKVKEVVEKEEAGG